MIRRILACALALLLPAGLARAEVYTALGGVIRIGSEERAILPQGLAADNDGGLIIVDSGNQCVLRAEGDGCELLAGSISAVNVMGRAIAGYLDADADKSLFSSPVDAAYLPNGMLIISDGGNSVLRVLTEGRMYTYSGAGGAGYKEGDRQEAMYSLPGGLAAAPDGTVYVADTLNHCIRVVDKDGGAALWCGQPGEAGFMDGALSEALFCEPAGLALDSDGALYVADSGNNRIRKIYKGQVTTVAGGGERAQDAMYAVGGFRDGDAAQARFLFPSGLCFDKSGALYIADSGNHAIRALTSDGTVVTVAGTGAPGYLDGAALMAMFNRPTDVCVADGRLYIADSLNRAVRALTIDD